MSEAQPSAASGTAPAKKNATPGELAPELFAAFSTIRNIARTINCEVVVPEVVFLGRRNAGKSSLIETFLGHIMMPVKDPAHPEEFSISRPVEIRMVNNPECENPRITILRDVDSGDAFPEQTDLTLAEVQKSLQARSKIRSEVPSRVVYESKYCMDMTLYDTPGLLHPSEGSGDDPEKIENFVLKLAQPSNRLLVCVEEACDWNLVEGVDFINRVDPRHERTIFVFNKMPNLISKFSSAPELTSFLRGGTQLPLIRAGRVTDKVFFTSLPSGVGRTDKSNIYKRKLASIVSQQLKELEALQYDSRFEGNIGALAVQKRILLWVWNRYQNVVIPAVIRHLRAIRGSAEKSKADFESRAALITPQELRKKASLFASSWVEALSSMLNRSLVGKPALNGQTLAEECACDDAFAAWTDANMERIEIDRNKVGGAQDRLYGSAQFERLMKEFRTIVSEAVTIDISSDEAATALGSTPSEIAPDVAWAACYLVQQKCSLLFPPLVQQLIARAKSIFLYLVEIADRLPGHGWMGTDRLPGEDVDDEIEDAETYPHFTMEVKSMYFDLIETLCKQCLDRCTMQFYDAKVLNFELRNNYTSLIESAKSSSAQKFTLQLTKALFQKVKERFVENVTLTCYDVLLVTLQTKLSHVILTRIAQIDDTQLRELFEAPVLQQRLNASIVEFDGIVEQSQLNDEKLMAAVGVFAHVNNQ